ncbi:MAG: cardiolipin synthase [Clostridia bacterium]|nr:cardiolipin synthase [Clostridia bacterium]
MKRIPPFKTLESKAYVKTGALRLFFVGAAITAEIAYVMYVMGELSARYPWISATITITAILVALMIYGRHENASMKMVWMLMIIAAPPFGTFMYLLTGLTGTTHAMRRRFISVDNRLQPFLPDDTETLRQLGERNASIVSQFRYIRNISGFPVYNNSRIEFFPDTVDIFERMKDDLRRAERFIFLEYYAIEDEKVFSEIHAILKERVIAGVDVRMFYDDIGSVFFINHDFVDKMEKDGIKCRIFNPMLPLTNVFMNNRDHRKIAVIDGIIAYTGGYNLADEYFNLTNPYGHWKDTGVRLEGEAARSMTYMFLETWNAMRGKNQEDHDFKPLFPVKVPTIPDAGFIQPYGDSPLTFENVAEDVYMNLLNGAQRYCWFTTPYLIITDEMVRTFLLAAGRGVDIRIITPGIPDKKMVYRVTRSSYRILARHGIRIFEYTPGFCHAKQCVCDDEIAVCGTINLDYRSLYHHFEDGVLMYDCDAVHDIKRDFDSLLPQCTEVTAEYAKHVPLIIRFWETLLRILAPVF